MSNFKILLWLIVVAILAGSAGYITRLSQAPPEKLASDTVRYKNQDSPATKVRPLWSWQFADVENQPHLISEWQGSWLVINFWATWCPPCMKEIPTFVTLQDKFRSQNVQFVGIAYDHLEAVQAFISETPINFPILLGGDDLPVFMRELGNKIGALPFTAVISPGGEIVKTQQGEWFEEDALEFLGAQLNTSSL